MTKKLFILMIVLLSTIPAFAQSVDTAWVRTYNGPGNWWDEAHAITLDGSGNLFVTGASIGSGTSFDYATIKYYSNGDTTWLRRFSGAANYEDLAYAIAVDGYGNVYVTGYSAQSSVRPYNYDYVTIKYYPNGETAWLRKYNGIADSSDWASDLTVDGSGNIYVTGSSYGNGTKYDYLTIKYYANGDTAWVRRYNGPSNSNDQAVDLVVDVSGNIYVTGKSQGSGTGYDFTTIKYYPDGSIAWIGRYNGPVNSDDYALALAVEVSGNVYVTGCSYNSGTDFDYATIKYYPNGDTAWVRRYNGPANKYDKSNAIAVDSYGNVYITGYSYRNETEQDYVTIKYYTDGDTAWVRRYNGPGVANAIAVDGYANVYVTGSNVGSGANYDFTTIRYDYVNGNELWVKKYNGPGNYDDYALAITAGSSGNVYVAGFCYGSGTDYDYATIKYVQNNNGTITGTVKNAFTLENLPEVLVEVLQDSIIKGSCITNNRGQFAIYGLVTGTYNIRAIKLGYVTKTYSGVQVTDGQTITQNFNLSPGNPEIHSITPAVGVSGKLATISINGAWFQNGITVKLTLYGENDIVADSSSINFISDTLVEATFDLTETVVDKWDLQIINPDSQSYYLQKSFNIIPFTDNILPYGNWEKFYVHNGSKIEVEVNVPESEDLFVLMKKGNMIDYAGTWSSQMQLSQGGNILAQSSSYYWDVAFHLKNQPAGTYNLGISAYERGVGVIKVCSALDTITFGEWHLREILRPYGFDWVQFDLPPGQSALHFQTEGYGMWSRIDVYLESLTNPTQHWYFYNWGYGYHIEGTIQNPPAGRYYVRYMDSAVLYGGTGDQKRQYMLFVDTEPIVTPPPLSPTITGLSTYTGNKGDTAIVVISGTGLDLAATVSLIRESFDNIVAYDVLGDSTGLELSSKFDFSSATPGVWKLVVTNPGLESDTAASPFIIESGGAPNLWVEILGRDQLRLGRTQTYIVRYGNEGTVDAFAPLLFLQFPPNLTVQLEEDTVGKILQQGYDTTSNVLVMVLPDILAGTSGQLGLQISTTETGSFLINGDITISPSTYIEVSTRAPDVSFTKLSTWNERQFDKTENVSTVEYDMAETKPWDDRPAGYHDIFWVDVIQDGIYKEGWWESGSSIGGESDPIGKKGVFMFPTSDKPLEYDLNGLKVNPVIYHAPTNTVFILKHMFSLRPEKQWSSDDANQIIQRYNVYFKGREFGFCAHERRDSPCKSCVGLHGDMVYPPGKLDEGDQIDFLSYQFRENFGFVRGKGKSVWFTSKGLLNLLTSELLRGITIYSATPEDKYGPTGFDRLGTLSDSLVRFVKEDKEFRYCIDFWNKEDATAPAQIVFVEDTLDQDFDPKTFSFTDVGFLKWNVPLGGGQYFNVNVDMRPDDSLIVNVEGTFDPDHRVIKWVFRSLDPLTGLPPEDPMAGFLPPIDSTGYQIGWVDFTVKPLPGLPTDTKITNQAFVNFDSVGSYNPAPKERPYVNTIDALPPNSNINPLSGTIWKDTFEVCWSGKDDTLGSGLKDYTIYVSVDSGPYQIWLSQTTATCSTYLGEFDHTYRFYSVARDNVGNVETVPDTADACIITLSYLVGDCNADKVVTITDVIYLINYLFKGGPEPVPREAGDVNCNTLVNVSDVIYLINYLFKGGPAPCQNSHSSVAMNKSTEQGYVKTSFVKFDEKGNGVISISSGAKVNVAGVQLELTYDSTEVGSIEVYPTERAEKLGLYYLAKDGNLVIGAVDIYGKNCISSGEGPLVTLKLKPKSEKSDLSSLTIEKAILVDTLAKELQVTIINGIQLSQIPKTFSLSQNYPNPFNPVTTIKYALPKDTWVKINIYNILGQKVKTLVDEFQVAGYKQVIWDTKNDDKKEVASGIYFYRIQACDFTKAKKMVILK
jgi:hypothetical protein